MESKSTTISTALLEGENLLKSSGFVLRPRRHAELLLEAALGVDRTTLYLMARDPLPEKAATAYESLLKRRLDGEPVQHIVGWAPFYGWKFLVDRGVFVPRFDSEVIVQRAVAICRENDWDAPEILDLCCGSGAIGLAAALELPFSKVILADYDLTALRYTAANAHTHGISQRTSVTRWDALTEPFENWLGRFDLILANPPYIPVNDLAALHPDVRDGEPRCALTDEDDGLTFYRRWAETIPALLKPDGVFITEVGDNASDDVIRIFNSSFDDLTILNDLSGNPRAVEARNLFGASIRQLQSKSTFEVNKL